MHWTSGVMTWFLISSVGGGGQLGIVYICVIVCQFLCSIHVMFSFASRQWSLFYFFVHVIWFVNVLSNSFLFGESSSVSIRQWVGRCTRAMVSSFVLITQPCLWGVSVSFGATVTLGLARWSVAGCESLWAGMLGRTVCRGVLLGRSLSATGCTKFTTLHALHVITLHNAPIV